MDDWFDALARRVRAASPEQQREAAVRAARLAVERFRPQDPLVAAAAGRLGAEPGVTEELHAACEALDEAALGDGDDEPAFVAARVAFAVRAALGRDPQQAALDAIYESAIAIADQQAVATAVDAVLPDAGLPGAGWYAVLEPMLTELGDDRLRKVSVALAEAMLERHPVEGRAVEGALKAARAGNTGPSIPRVRLHRKLRRLQAAGPPGEASAAFVLWSALRSVPLEGARAAAFSAWAELRDDPAVRRRLADLGVLPEP